MIVALSASQRNSNNFRSCWIDIMSYDAGGVDSSGLTHGW